MKNLHKQFNCMLKGIETVFVSDVSSLDVVKKLFMYKINP